MLAHSCSFCLIPNVASLFANKMRHAAAMEVPVQSAILNSANWGFAATIIPTQWLRRRVRVRMYSGKPMEFSKEWCPHRALGHFGWCCNAQTKTLFESHSMSRSLWETYETYCTNDFSATKILIHVQGSSKAVAGFFHGSLLTLSGLNAYMTPTVLREHLCVSKPWDYQSFPEPRCHPRQEL